MENEKPKPKSISFTIKPGEPREKPKKWDYKKYILKRNLTK